MKPARANFVVLVRECGLLALTVGFVGFRILKLGLTMILYIGRVDTPLLHNQCGQVGGFRIDREPYIFQIDILQHEVRDCLAIRHVSSVSYPHFSHLYDSLQAHRHPYIEYVTLCWLSTYISVS